MLTEWTSHLHNSKDKEDFQRQVQGSKPVLSRLMDIISLKEKALDRSEISIETYSLPSWEFRQAHKNGNRESLQFMKTLVDLDKQLPIQENK